MQVVVAATNPSLRFKLSVANRTSSMVARMQSSQIGQQRLALRKAAIFPLGPFDLQIYPGTGAFLSSSAEQWIFADGREKFRSVGMA